MQTRELVRAHEVVGAQRLVLGATDRVKRSLRISLTPTSQSHQSHKLLILSPLTTLAAWAQGPIDQHIDLEDSDSERTNDVQNLGSDHVHTTKQATIPNR